MCRVSQNAPGSLGSGVGPGTGLSQFLTRILDQLSPSAWLPAIMVVANVALLLQLYSQRNLDIGHAVLELTKEPIGILIVLVMAIIVTSVVTQAFAFSVIRVLEGYWGSIAVLTFWSSLRTRRHVARVARLRGRYKRDERDAFAEAKDHMRRSDVPWEIAEILERRLWGIPVDTYDPDLVARADRIGWRRYAPPQLLHKLDAIHSLLEEYPLEHRIMPTKLGNTLRSHEDRLVRDPDEPLEEFVLRRYAAMDADLHVQHRRSRSQLDIYSLLTLIFAFFAILSLAALIPSTGDVAGAVVFGAVYLLLSVVSYRAAIACARSYASVLRAINSRAAGGARGE